MSFQGFLLSLHHFCSSFHQEVDSFLVPGLWAGLCLALANLVKNVTWQRLEKHLLTTAGLFCSLGTWPPPKAARVPHLQRTWLFPLPLPTACQLSYATQGQSGSPRLQVSCQLMTHPGEGQPGQPDWPKAELPGRPHWGGVTFHACCFQPISSEPVTSIHSRWAPRDCGLILESSRCLALRWVRGSPHQGAR